MGLGKTPMEESLTDLIRRETGNRQYKIVNQVVNSGKVGAVCVCTCACIHKAGALQGPEDPIFLRELLHMPLADVS